MEGWVRGRKATEEPGTRRNGDLFSRGGNGRQGGNELAQDDPTSSSFLCDSKSQALALLGKEQNVE